MAADAVSTRPRVAILLFPLALAACEAAPPEPTDYRFPVQVVPVTRGDPVGVTGQPVAYVVGVLDANGQALAGVTISWTIESGGGSIDPALTTTRVLQPSFPPMAAATHTLSAGEGIHTVTATARDVPGMPRAVFETRAVSGIVKIRTESQSPWDYGLDVAFYPSELVVLPGQTVAWLWSCSGPECPLYDVTFEDDPTEPISSSPQGEGTHFRTFDRPGEYRYRSTSHSTGFAEGMVGIVRADAVDGESNRR